MYSVIGKFRLEYRHEPKLLSHYLLHPTSSCISWVTIVSIMNGWCHTPTVHFFLYNLLYFMFYDFRECWKMDDHAISHDFIVTDEAGFNLAKTRRRGRNVIGHWVTLDVPGHRGGTITMCTAISTTHGVPPPLKPTLDYTTQPKFSHFWTDSPNFWDHQRV